ncbi:MAG TPA: iron-sulfur cluster assembly accessory protein [Acidiferrobacteraceae bacterium]|nr:iron-sulfur cluster assembly accessory protein [Acidiferrobacteraceae bacterium]
MIKLTQSAADQIRASAKETGINDLRLRLAATKKEDGTIEYGMGFDDNHTDTDTEFKIKGITMVWSKNSAALLTGVEIDYVEITPGQHQFIFFNPNDPVHKPVTEEGQH